jgi:hypothetical protein
MRMGLSLMFTYEYETDQSHYDIVAYAITEAINSAMSKLKEEHNVRGIISHYQTVERPSDSGVNMIDFGYLTTEEIQLFISHSGYAPNSEYDELYVELINNKIPVNSTIRSLTKQEAADLLKRIKTELRQKHRDMLRDEIIKYHVSNIRGMLDDGILESKIEKERMEQQQ